MMWKLEKSLKTVVMSSWKFFSELYCRTLLDLGDVLTMLFWWNTWRQSTLIEERIHLLTVLEVQVQGQLVVMRQYIMVAVCGGENGSLHGSHETRELGKDQAHNILQSTTPVI